jgi:hypothetical protein
VSSFRVVVSCRTMHEARSPHLSISLNLLGEKEKGRAARAGQGKTQEAAMSRTIDKSYVLIICLDLYS